MLLAEVVATSRTVAGTRSRLAKRAAIADLLRRADPDDLEIAVTYLAGELRQRRTGLGWASLRDLPPPAAQAALTIGEVDTTFRAMAEMAGPGSQRARADAAQALFGTATADEQRFLAGLVSGDVRQGALDSIVLDALADASDVPAAEIRRAAMLQGATPPVAVAALTGGREAVAAVAVLAPGRAVRPMLASSAPDVAAALEKVGRRSPRRSTRSSTASASRSTASATTSGSSPAAWTTSPNACRRSPTPCARWRPIRSSSTGRP